MCATNVSGHLQRVVGGTSIAWAFLTRLEALWEVSQTRALRRQRQMNLVAIREGRTMPVEPSQATAAAAVSAGKRDQNLEQEDPNAQARVRERPCGDSRIRQAEEISSAVIQRQLSSERVVQDCQQQIAELLELKEREDRLLQAD